MSSIEPAPLARWSNYRPICMEEKKGLAHGRGTGAGPLGVCFSPGLESTQEKYLSQSVERSSERPAAVKGPTTCFDLLQL